MQNTFRSYQCRPKEAVENLNKILRNEYFHNFLFQLDSVIYQPSGALRISSGQTLEEATPHLLHGLADFLAYSFILQAPKPIAAQYTRDESSRLLLSIAAEPTSRDNRLHYHVDGMGYTNQFDHLPGRLCKPWFEDVERELEKAELLRHPMLERLIARFSQKVV
jgi:hypothetical protein